MSPRKRRATDDGPRLPSRAASADELLARALPHNLDAERTVLASVLLDPRTLPEVRRAVRPEAFFDARHARLFAEMLELASEGKPVEIDLLLHKLNAAAAMPSVGGASYLCELAEFVPTAMHGPAYAKIVADAFRQRRLIAAGLQLLQLGHDDLHAERNIDRLTAEAMAAVRDAIEDSGGMKSSGAKAVLRNMADVKPERIEWLWPGRIAVGMMTLIAGDPGLGKSFFSCDLAARVSLGSPWPDDVLSRAPLGGVVMLNAEDPIAQVVRPRLDAAGADVRRINAIEAVRDFGAEHDRQFDLSRDLATLEAAIEATPDCKLVVIDPLSSYVGTIDAHRANEVRAVVDPLAKLAARHRVALVCVTHLNKGGSGGPAIYRASGSLSFIAAARAGFYVCRDKDRPERRLLLPAKNNLAPDSLGMAYAIVDGCVAWEAEPVAMTADDAMQQAAGPGGEDRSERNDAAEWLGEVLAEGPVSARELETMARNAGLSWQTVKRAKSNMGIESQRHGFGKGSTCSWSLPSGGHDRNSPIERIEITPRGPNSMDSMNPMDDESEAQTWSA